jgi:hypothetical protein
VINVEGKTARAIAEGRALVSEIMRDAPKTHDPFADTDDTRREDEPGGWIIAGFDGVCSRGGEEFQAHTSTTIRADGGGSWECRECVDADGEDSPWNVHGEDPYAVGGAA